MSKSDRDRPAPLAGAWTHTRRVHRPCIRADPSVGLVGVRNLRHIAQVLEDLTGPTGPRRFVKSELSQLGQMPARLDQRPAEDYVALSKDERRDPGRGLNL